LPLISLVSGGYACWGHRLVKISRPQVRRAMALGATPGSISGTQPPPYLPPENCPPPAFSEKLE